MANRYFIQTPDPTFKGQTLGIKFNGGVAIIEPLTLPKWLGRTVEQTVELFKRDFPKYTVTAITPQMEDAGAVAVGLPADVQAKVVEANLKANAPKGK